MTTPAKQPGPPPLPRDAVIAVTHHCNAHCVMCNIWKSHARDVLMPEHMRVLPPGLRTINLSGGEPFLREDLPEFVREVRARCPQAQITISTNAYQVQRIAERMQEIQRIDPTIRLAVSLDGLGKTHDTVRGDQGAFDAAVKLIETLLKTGFKGLRLGMTLSNANLDQLLDVSEFASRRGLELGIVAAHSSRTHLGVTEVSQPSGAPRWLADVFEVVIGRWLRSWRPKQWLRAHFTYYTYQFLTGNPWKGFCQAGRDFFFLQADGTVYNCSVAGRAMGNVTRDSWEAIWQGTAAGQARNDAAHCQENCWMICTARSEYRRRWGRVLWWILSRKLLAHLALLRLPGDAEVRSL